MKTQMILFLAALLASALVHASDADTVKVKKTIVKTISVDDQGTRIIDSIIVDDGKTVHIEIDSMLRDSDCPGYPFHFQGMRGRRMAFWNDDSGKHYEMMIEGDGDSIEAIVGKLPRKRVKTIIIDDEDVPFRDRKMKFWYGDEEDPKWVPCPGSGMMFRGKELPQIPEVPDLPCAPRHYRQQTGMIDLNDPSIIQFERKEQKDGTEKITIIRKIEKRGIE
ncbi:MAG TPA: hypothetical protein PLK12_12370 [Prolixibacteraceae bacterium]|nr:hypothetical protein [Prolixibacteraceae bacterium]